MLLCELIESLNMNKNLYFLKQMYVKHGFAWGQACHYLQQQFTDWYVLGFCNFHNSIEDKAFNHF